MADRRSRIVYRGTCIPNAAGTCRVIAIAIDTRQEEVLEPKQRPGVHFHSPTGYGWGYLGSGPAQLAQDLLRHHSGREPRPSLYQRFKAEVIARYRIDAGWLLTGREVANWLTANAVTLDWIEDDEQADLAGVDAWLDGSDHHGEVVNSTDQEELPF